MTSQLRLFEQFCSVIIRNPRKSYRAKYNTINRSYKNLAERE